MKQIKVAKYEKMLACKHFYKLSRGFQYRHKIWKRREEKLVRERKKKRKIQGHMFGCSRGAKLEVQILKKLR